MSWIAVGSIGGAAVGGLFSNQAANTQANAARQASQTQMDMFNRTQGNLQPWMQGGNLALSDLMTRMGLSSPGTPGTPASMMGGGRGDVGGLTHIMSGTPGTPAMGNPNSPNFGQLTHQFGLQDFQASPAYQFNLQQG